MSRIYKSIKPSNNKAEAGSSSKNNTPPTHDVKVEDDKKTETKGNK